MKWIHALAATVLFSTGCVGGQESGLAVETSECAAKGMGTLGGDEFFVGRLIGDLNQGVHGRWVHWGPPVCVEPDQEGYHLGERDHLVAMPEQIDCRLNGFGFATVAGSALWNGQDGHTFHLQLQDYRGAQPDQYRLLVFDSTGQPVYIVNDQVAAGDISVLPRR